MRGRPVSKASHAGHWFDTAAVAEAYAAKGDRKKAIESYSKALKLVTLEKQKTRIAATMDGLKKQTPGQAGG